MKTFRRNSFVTPKDGPCEPHAASCGSTTVTHVFPFEFPLGAHCGTRLGPLQPTYKHQGVNNSVEIDAEYLSTQEMIKEGWDRPYPFRMSFRAVLSPLRSCCALHVRNHIAVFHVS